MNLRKQLRLIPKDYYLKRNFLWTVYNIGVLYVRLGESQKELKLKNKNWNKALAKFSNCFKEKKIREYAKKDPELQCFREEFRKQFDKLITKYENRQS